MLKSASLSTPTTCHPLSIRRLKSLDESQATKLSARASAVGNIESSRDREAPGNTNDITGLTSQHHHIPALPVTTADIMGATESKPSSAHLWKGYVRAL